MSRSGVFEEIITGITLLNELGSVKRAIRVRTRYQYTTIQNSDIISFVKVFDALMMSINTCNTLVLQ